MKRHPFLRPAIAGLTFAVGTLCFGLALLFNRSRARVPQVDPEDAALQVQWSALRDATPETLHKLEVTLSSTRALLPAAGPFDAWLKRQARNWTVLASATDRYPGLEVRRCALAYNHPTLGAWPDIVETIKALCSEPGLTLDAFSLAAAPDGSDAFVQAQITLTARLRP
jgi:hypothetical protein